MDEFAGLHKGEDPAFPAGLATKLLEGAVSYHDHYGWEKGGGVGNRCRQTYDSVDIVSSAKQAGMRAVVLRNLYFSSAGDAYLVRKLVPGIDVIGGIFLISEIGGVNPTAVETAMTYGGGAKFLCLATDSSAHGARLSGVSEDEIAADPVKYITPFDQDGAIKPEMTAIFRMIAEFDILLETGSLSATEILKVVAAAKAEGVRKILVTHPTPWFCRMSVEQMKEAIAMGAIIEFTWMFYSHSISYMSRLYGYTGSEGTTQRPELVGDAFDQIRAIGAENCVLSTDFGTIELPLPVEGLRQFIFCLLDLGMTADEIALMVRTNPARLLGLPELAPSPALVGVA